jgi:SNF family Na+-dependent transporter
MMASMNPLMPIIFIFLLILAILWFLLPFAIFGTKDKLDALIAEIKRNTDSVDALHETMKK